MSARPATTRFAEKANGMDWAWALLFFAWVELLSLPLRLAMAAWPAPADVRRLLSRVAGVAVLLAPLWLGGHMIGWVLGGVFGLAWTAAGLWVGLRLGLSGAARAGETPRRAMGKLLAYDGQHWRGELALDGATLLLYLGVVAWRRWVPEMTTYVLDGSAAEKFMNAMIWWSCWHADKLPPQDYWLAGHPLTYYYWGHWLWSWVGRVGGFPGTIALTLAFARMVVLGWEAMTLLARAMGLRRAGAMLAATTAAWGGNACAVAMAWACRRPGGGFDWRSYDFWKPSRAIGDAVVDEFPAFSTVLGDFHSHQLALGWLLGWLAILVAGWRWAGLPRRWNAMPPWERSAMLRRLAVAGTAWTTLGMATVLTNAWNLPVMALAMAGAAAWALWRLGGSELWRRRAPLLALALAQGAAIAIGIWLLRGGEGLPLGGGAPAPAATAGRLAQLLARVPMRLLSAQYRSTLGQLWSMWGLAAAALAVAAAAKALGWGRGSGRGQARERLAPAMLALAGCIFVAAGWPPLAARIPGGTAWAWAGVACWGAAMAADARPWLTARAAAMLAATCLLLAGLEVAYIPDAFVGAYARYNTYFKLSYPAWSILMIAATAGAIGLWRGRPRQKPGTRMAARPGSWPWAERPIAWGLRAAVAFWLALLATFTVLGAASRVAKAMAGDSPARRPTLDAFDFLGHHRRVGARDLSYALEGPMLAWIRDNVPPGDVVAEAAWLKPGETFVGGYDFNGRVASLAGHPVPLGWAHHERQWRGRAGMDPIYQRQLAVDRFYAAPDAAAMRRAARELGLRWALYGVLEHDLYAERRGLGARVLENLSRVGKLAAAYPPGSPGIFLFDLRDAMTPKEPAP